jgi:hypothetical protein
MFRKTNVKPTLESALAGFAQALEDLRLVSAYREEEMGMHTATIEYATAEHARAKAEKDKADRIASKLTELIEA